MLPLPPFDEDSLLPAGDYELILAELCASLLVQGPGASHPNWDIQWRAYLVEQFAVIVEQLQAVGVTEILVDGSFTEDKDHPNDIDGYCVCDPAPLHSGWLERQLNLLDPHKVWTWDPGTRCPYRGYRKRQLPMWHQYRIELYPHVGQPTGLRDEHGNELEFPATLRARARAVEHAGS